MIRRFENATRILTNRHDHHRRTAEKPVSKAITLCWCRILREDNVVQDRGKTAKLACNTSMVRGWMPSACPAATLDGLQERRLWVTTIEFVDGIADAPFVYDPDIDAGANKRICAHEPCGTSPHYEDIDMGRRWRHDELQREGGY
jgi:hypothetical protein